MIASVKRTFQYQEGFEVQFFDLFSKLKFVVFGYSSNRIISTILANYQSFLLLNIEKNIKKMFLRMAEKLEHRKNSIAVEDYRKLRQVLAVEGAF